ncbi:hypothetical protein D3C72_1064750 [compost metagenome]
MSERLFNEIARIGLGNEGGWVALHKRVDDFLCFINGELIAGIPRKKRRLTEKGQNSSAIVPL